MSGVIIPQLGAGETCLLSLWARAVEARRADAILRDAVAVRIVDALGHDFSGYPTDGPELAAVCARTALIDEWTGEFLSRHPDGVIVELGAGLDGRCERVDNGHARWVAVDRAEVIALRGQFVQEAARQQTVAASLDDETFLDELHITPDTAVLVIVEGVLMYMEEAAVRGLLARLTRRFPGAVIIFDCFSPFMARQAARHLLMKHVAARARWGVHNPISMQDWGVGLAIGACVSMYDLPGFRARLPERMLCAGERSARLRGMHRICRGQLGLD